MRILVLGGDGFCGWPSSLHLSRHGHDVTIVDSFVRRRIDDELGVQSLTPIAPPVKRLAVWRRLTGSVIGLERVDVAREYDALLDVLLRRQPDAVVHFAEQRAAPYSMRDSAHKRYTIENNVNGTHNLLAALVEAGADCHVVHLGTMGSGDGLYPTMPGSIYHLTQSLDQLLFQFYAQNDHLRVTDLHQGIVWGTQTRETRLDPSLVNRFDYDGEFGTVLNRFLVQAAIGYPLTVHGTGGQTHGYINIQDAVRCVRLAVESGDQVTGRVRIMDQVAETLRVRDLAVLLEQLLGATVSYLPNPRAEADENELAVTTDQLRGLGFDPILLEEGPLQESVEIATRFADRCDRRRIPSASYWNEERRSAASVRS